MKSNPTPASREPQEGVLWPSPGDQDIDLNVAAGPGWIDDVGRAAKRRLPAAGVWLRAFDAEKQYPVGEPVRTLTVTKPVNGCIELACADRLRSVTSVSGRLATLYGRGLAHEVT